MEPTNFFKKSHDSHKKVAWRICQKDNKVKKSICFFVVLVPVSLSDEFYQKRYSSIFDFSCSFWIFFSSFFFRFFSILDLLSQKRVSGIIQVHHNIIYNLFCLIFPAGKRNVVKTWNTFLSVLLTYKRYININQSLGFKASQMQ